MPPSETRSVSSRNIIDEKSKQTNEEKLFSKDIKLGSDLRNSYKTLWGYFEHEVQWLNVIFMLAIHLYTLKFYWTTTPKYLLWGLFCAILTGFGVTAGAHRLYTHRCYKATLPLRILLMLLFSCAGQNSIYVWVRDHRVHHKFSETDADPHNSRRGFFFAHCGWLMMKKHPEVLKKGGLVDCHDLLEDPVVLFHKKYYFLLFFVMSLFVPTLIPYYFWDWNLQLCIDTAIGKWVTSLHFTWLVNSAAHLWGSRPYDKNICPVETKAVSFLALGEGWHNYHHTFPWDYKAAELGYYWNMTTFLIDVFAKIGWAYDLKQPTPELVEKVVRRSGDGSHFKWGHDVIEEHEGMELVGRKISTPSEKSH